MTNSLTCSPTLSFGWVHVLSSHAIKLSTLSSVYLHLNCTDSSEPDSMRPCIWRVFVLILDVWFRRSNECPTCRAKAAFDKTVPVKVCKDKWWLGGMIPDVAKCSLLYWVVHGQLSLLALWAQFDSLHHQSIISDCLKQRTWSGDDIWLQDVAVVTELQVLCQRHALPTVTAVGESLVYKIWFPL